MIFGFLPQNLKTEAVAVAFIMSWHDGTGEDGADDASGGWRGSAASCTSRSGMRRDALFEVCDAVLCKPGRVLMLAELCLEPECRRGHGAVYDALNCGEVRFARLRRALSVASAAGMGGRPDPAGRAT